MMSVRGGRAGLANAGVDFRKGPPADLILALARSCLRLGRQRLDRRANRPHNQPRGQRKLAPAGARSGGRTRAKVAPQFR